MVDDIILDALELEGERRKYAKKRGIEALADPLTNRHWNDEEMYRICNEKGITWQEYFGMSEKKEEGVLI